MCFYCSFYICVLLAFTSVLCVGCVLHGLCSYLLCVYMSEGALMYTVGFISLGLYYVIQWAFFIQTGHYYSCVFIFFFFGLRF
jgi:hypothetical protein